jgi:endonuclease/exonuclease/phosphatase family metal-dependent hydrolase
MKRTHDLTRPFSFVCCLQVMTLHSEMAAFRVQHLAKRNCPDSINQNSDNDNDNTLCSDNMLPYIIAGDWNIKPPDATYKLLTTGSMPPDDPAYPEPAKSKLRPSHTLMIWEPRIQSMRSAYAACHEGQEPDFTNYAAPRTVEADDEGFIDTLDYIFVSPEWKVTATTDVPTRDQASGPFPNLQVTEPSDHILLAADMELETNK